jgi:hypothetical protein
VDATRNNASTHHPIGIKVAVKLVSGTSATEPPDCDYRVAGEYINPSHRQREEHSRSIPASSMAATPPTTPPTIAPEITSACDWAYIDP